MKKSEPLPQFTVYILKVLIEYARDRNVDATSLLREKIIYLDSLNDDDFISVKEFNDIWKILSTQLCAPSLGLHFGKALATKGEGHFLFTLMKNCENMKNAVQSLIRYHNLMTNAIKPELKIIDKKAIIELIHPQGIENISPHVSETAMSLLITAMRRITGESITIEKVQFSHKLQGKLDEYIKIFNIEPEFEQDYNRLIFPEKEILHPLPLSSREFESYLRHYTELKEERSGQMSSLAEKTTLLLKKNILRGKEYSLDATASAFDISKRYLQQNLKEEGFGFQELLDTVRKEIAMHLLKHDEVLICDIAYLLGFAEQSSFNHAFKKWTGKTPGKFRKDTK